MHVYQDAPSESSSSYEEKHRHKHDSVRELEASLSHLSLGRKDNKVDRRKKAEQVVQRRLADVCGKEAKASALPPHTSPLDGVGVGMILEPSDPGSDYCHVSSMADGGALANDGRVKPGDKLVRVDGFDCMGVPRAVIKSRVLGPPHSEVVLEFCRPGFARIFKVTLLRTPGFAATRSAVAGPQDTHSASTSSSLSGKVPSEVLAAREQGEQAQAAMLPAASRHAATEAATADVASTSARHAADAGTDRAAGGGILPAPQAQALTNFPSPWVPVPLPCGSRYWWNKETNETTDVGAAQPTTMYHRPHMAPRPAAILPPPSHPPPTTANAYLPAPTHPAPGQEAAYQPLPPPEGILPPPSHPPPMAANAYLPAPTHPALGHPREAAYQKPSQDPHLTHVLLPRTYTLN